MFISQDNPVVCAGADPVGVECRVKNGDGTLYPFLQDQQDITCDTAGLVCLNAENPDGCLDYEVRYVCSGPIHVTSSFRVPIHSLKLTKSICIKETILSCLLLYL